MRGNIRIKGNDPVILAGLDDFREDQAAEQQEELEAELAMASMYDFVSEADFRDTQLTMTPIGVVVEDDGSDYLDYDF